jgi:hypothetical protein
VPTSSSANPTAACTRRPPPQQDTLSHIPPHKHSPSSSTHP